MPSTPPPSPKNTDSANDNTADRETNAEQPLQESSQTQGQSEPVTSTTNVVSQNTVLSSSTMNYQNPDGLLTPQGTLARQAVPHRLPPASSDTVLVQQKAQLQPPQPRPGGSAPAAVVAVPVDPNQMPPGLYQNFLNAYLQQHHQAPNQSQSSSLQSGATSSSTTPPHQQQQQQVVLPQQFMVVIPVTAQGQQQQSAPPPPQHQQQQQGGIQQPLVQQPISAQHLLQNLQQQVASSGSTRTPSAVLASAARSDGLLESPGSTTNTSTPTVNQNVQASPQERATGNHYFSPPLGDNETFQAYYDEIVGDVSSAAAIASNALNPLDIGLPSSPATTTSSQKLPASLLRSPPPAVAGTKSQTLLQTQPLEPRASSMVSGGPPRHPPSLALLDHVKPKEAPATSSNIRPEVQALQSPTPPQPTEHTPLVESATTVASTPLDHPQGAITQEQAHHSHHGSAPPSPETIPQAPTSASSTSSARLVVFAPAAAATNHMPPTVPVPQPSSTSAGAVELYPAPYRAGYGAAAPADQQQRSKRAKVEVVGGGYRIDPSTHLEHDEESPDVHVMTLLHERGYRATKKTSAIESGYSSVPTPFQVASFGAEVVRAVNSSDVQRLSALLECGISANPCNSFGDSIVNIACKRSDYPILKCLVDKGCNLRVCDAFGRTPLHHAAWGGEFCEPLVDLILQVDVQQLFVQDKQGRSPLQYVRKELWKDWVSLFDQRKEVYWPIGGTFQYRGITTSDQEQDGGTRISLDLARMVASGEITTEEVTRMDKETRRKYRYRESSVG